LYFTATQISICDSSGLRAPKVQDGEEEEAIVLISQLYGVFFNDISEHVMRERRDEERYHDHGHSHHYQ